MNTSYLVNIVANDFKDGSYIFDPFLLDQQSHSPETKSTVNGNGNGHATNGNGNVNGNSTATSVVGDAVNGMKETVEGLAQGVKNVMNSHGTAEGVAINGHGHGH